MGISFGRKLLAACLLVASLTLLEEATSPDVLVRAYELDAMSLLGYQPELRHCLRDARSVEGPGAAFHLSAWFWNKSRSPA